MVGQVVHVCKIEENQIVYDYGKNTFEKVREGWRGEGREGGGRERMYEQ